MLTTLQEIVDRVVQGYSPDRIIVFGSRAAGEARDDSDLDLLIVKETHDRPLERRISVERLLLDRSIALDIHVYTPEEMRRLFSLSDPFVEEVLEKGKVIYMREPTAGWIKEAQDDLDTSSILHDHQKYRGACIHSQQAVEKALKALLIEKAERPPRTHDIVELINRAKAAGWAEIQISMDDAVFLNSIYRGRYPTDEGLLPHGEPTSDDAQRAVTAARTVLERIQTLLQSPA
jgi:HEPN domain-containing protein/predicted nucleotidyltransferase